MATHHASSNSASPAMTDDHNISANGFRETIESIVLALILAFLFRTFEAQAFEIPTGSMGPTLVGRHKDLRCRSCGFHYRVGASVEVDPHTEVPLPGNDVVQATCPLCRYPMALDPAEAADGRDVLSYKGDRIWVTRAPYTLADPKRFDVAVFRKPEVSDENYIKRLVGLPNETLRIARGDVYVRHRGEQQFSIVRKSPEKIRAVWLPVFDSDFVSPQLVEAGWPARWQPDWQGDAPPEARWQVADNRRQFTARAPGDEVAWIRYWHLVPDIDDWQAIRQGPLPRDYAFPRPQLITDFCEYNSGLTAEAIRRTRPEQLGIGFLGLHWVGDLAVECEWDVPDQQGQLLMELIEGGQRFVCRFDVASGTVDLTIDGRDDFHPVARTSAHGPGNYRIALVNFDDQLLVWFNDRLLRFDRPTTYEGLPAQRPTPHDLSPVALGIRGCRATVRHVRIFRDTYYIAGFQHGEGMLTDQVRNPYLFPHITRQKLARFMSTPSWWGAFDQLATMNYELRDGQYLALGDNSPNSGDSRVWAARGDGSVRREQILGKALFVYWPHAWPAKASIGIPVGHRTVYFPFYPNFRRMRAIR